ncbi:hypothetical protein THIX_50062 [Thiomonas sp. X19]|nr:hypothetical protein THIX_50062 [Thiomonas sp. X19]
MPESTAPQLAADSLFEAQRLEHQGGRTKASEAHLEQIEADEGRQPQPGRVEQVDLSHDLGQHQAEQHHEPGHDADHTIDCH